MTDTPRYHPPRDLLELALDYHAAKTEGWTTGRHTSTTRLADMLRRIKTHPWLTQYTGPEHDAVYNALMRAGREMADQVQRECGCERCQDIRDDASAT